jgi:single-strand selective monofunctional uracil DNA glycosylase
VRFSPPVRHVYNPLVYARDPHESYLARYAAGPKRVVFVGMNPGPWGMAQTGVPFGEVMAVRDWLGISGAVRAPPDPHARVPVLGFECPRSEVSGRRLWGMFRDSFDSAESFSRQIFVSNYCPLLFLDESGRNLTPDRISREDQAALFPPCDTFLAAVIDLLRPEWLVGVGVFAGQRIRAILGDGRRPGVKAAAIIHPSPANPRAQKDWAGQVRKALGEQGVLPCGEWTSDPG